MTWKHCGLLAILFGLLDIFAVMSGLIRILCEDHGILPWSRPVEFLIGSIGCFIMCWGALIVEPEGV